jgi:hypothetical protein
LPILAYYGNIQLCIVKDKAAAADDFARAMVRAIQSNNQSGLPTRLIMPVGPTGQYRLFVEKCHELRLDLSRLLPPRAPGCHTRGDGISR